MLRRSPSERVVNCFQISIFAVHEQRIELVNQAVNVVNCFQISIFAVHEQRLTCEGGELTGCELLSN